MLSLFLRRLGSRQTARILVCLAGLALSGCVSDAPREEAVLPEAVDLSGGEPVLAPPASSRPAALPPPIATNPAPAVTSPPPAQPAPAPSLAQASLPLEGWISLKQWSDSSGLAALSRVSPASAPTFVLHSAHNTVVVQPGTRLARWEGLEVHLGFAPQLAHGQLYVHSLDLKKTLRPALQTTGPLGWSANPLIVLDPGHGGINAGTRSVLGSFYEKEYTLDWALRAQNLLLRDGWQVLLTRTNDVDIAISNRVNFAVEHKAGLFVSLHFNSAGHNQSEMGLETYCLTPAGMPSSLTREYIDDLGLICPNNAFDEQNLQLALRLHRALLQVNPHDRGVRRARFPGVLRGQTCPAVLIEGGYLSNPQEARRIAEPAYRQKLAESLARSIERLYEAPLVARPIPGRHETDTLAQARSPETRAAQLPASASAPHQP